MFWQYQIPLLSKSVADGLTPEKCGTKKLEMKKRRGNFSFVYRIKIGKWTCGVRPLDARRGIKSDQWGVEGYDVRVRLK